MNPSESAVRKVIAQIESAWRNKEFAGLEECFHEDAVIVGSDYVEFARGRAKCAESYRDFATNTSVLSYAESAHSLRLWETTAIYTYNWEMTYQREDSQAREKGSDQLVFQLTEDRWQLIWRYMVFAPSD